MRPIRVSIANRLLVWSETNTSLDSRWATGRGRRGGGWREVKVSESARCIVSRRVRTYCSWKPSLGRRRERAVHARVAIECRRDELGRAAGAKCGWGGCFGAGATWTPEAHVHELGMQNQVAKQESVGALGRMAGARGRLRALASMMSGTVRHAAHPAESSTRNQ